MDKRQEDRSTEALQGRPLSNTRRRFLLMASSSAAVSLMSCGYGFVAPKNTAPGGEDPLILNDSAEEEAILAFFVDLQQNTLMQENFIRDPTRAMISSGIIPSSSDLQVDRANRLLLYMLGNHSLRERITSIALRYDSLNRINNKYTNANLNLPTLHSAEHEFESSPDWDAAFDE